MIKYVLINYVPTILYIFIVTFISFITIDVKKYLTLKASTILLEKNRLVQAIGFERYKKDILFAKQTINAIEQLGKELDWSDIIKHSKATEIISKNTNLSSEEIFQIIKATVGLFKHNN